MENISLLASGLGIRSPVTTEEYEHQAATHSQGHEAEPPLPRQWVSMCAELMFRPVGQNQQLRTSNVCFHSK